MSPSTLAGLAEALLGPGVAVAGGAVKDWDAPLPPEEEEAVARAVPRRRAEFAAGRAAARAALLRLGRPPAPLPREASGPPRWPEGVTGSITHGGGSALAAVGPLGPGLRALGLDLEVAGAVTPDLAAAICRLDEDGNHVARVFGAKEAAFKAQFALSGRLLGFEAFRVRLDGDAFAAELMEDAGPLPAGAVVTGRQATRGALLLSAARIA